jgi:hypothetical protein
MIPFSCNISTIRIEIMAPSEAAVMVSKAAIAVEDNRYNLSSLGYF